MGLPKIELPLFEIELPSMKKKIKYRAFTVKEEKNLLIAQESKDWDQMMLSINQLLTNCIVDDIDIDSLAMFDIEYLMLHIRAKSVNNVIEYQIKDPDTGEPVNLEFKIDDVFITFPDKDYSKIIVSDDYAIKMRYPSMNEMNIARSLGEDNKSVETLFNMMVSCIDSVVNDAEVFKLKDFSEADIIDFVENLPKSAVDGMKKFFENMPAVKYKAEWEDKDGNKKSVPIEGLESFFT